MKRILSAIFIVLCLAHISYAATGDITACRILSSGWEAEIDITGFVDGGTYNFGLGTNNDPTNAKIIFTIVSEGYDPNGTLGTITRPVTGTAAERQPYPNQALKDEVEAGGTLTVTIALSKAVYADDESGEDKSGTDPTVTITSGFYTDDGAGGSSFPNNAIADLAVTNNSALEYPKCIGRWAWVGYERVTSDFLLEADCFQEFGENKHPVACVKFDAADQSAHSSATVTVIDMTVSTRTGDANPVIVYAATMDIDALDQGEVIDCQFRAYPWVGDANSILDSRTTADGVAQPDERLGPLHLVNDKSGTYGRGFVVVDPINGQVVTTWDSGGNIYVRATQAAAEAAYAGNNTLSINTIGNAARAIQDYNNDNNSRNEPGAGSILLVEGNHAFPGTATPELNSQNTWMTITKMSTGTRANTVINSATVTSLDCQKFKIEDVYLNSADNNVIFGNITTDIIWLHDNDINLTAAAPISTYLCAYATQNNITDINPLTGYTTIKCPFVLIRGNTGPAGGLPGDMYCIIGNRDITPLFLGTGNAKGQQVSDNAICAFNIVYDNENPITLGTSTNIIHGFAIVQNCFEKVVAVEALITIMGETVSSNHIIVWCNTFAGERTIVGYSNSATNLHINWSQKYNIHEDWNNKGDIFYEDGNCIGNWPISYNVGTVGQVYESAGFPGDFDGILVVNTGTAGYTDDKSYTGDGEGNGDYTLTESSDALNLVPAGEAVLPYDLAGEERRNDGTGAAGAYEYILPGWQGTIFIGSKPITNPAQIMGIDISNIDRIRIGGVDR